VKYDTGVSDPQRPALDAFYRRLQLPFREDTHMKERLGQEAEPLLEALAFAIEAAGADPLALEYRDALGMSAHLGRCAALWRVTPTALLVCIDAVIEGLDAVGLRSTRELERTLRAVMFEGYCAALEERTQDDVARRAASELRPVRLAPRCWAIIVAGEQAADSLRVALDRACRTMLDADARACLVHLVSAPHEDLASEVFAFDATARMIGVETVFSGVDARWRDAAEGHAELSRILHYETLEEGLQHALQTTGVEIRATGPLARLWSRVAKSQSG
jgi:hypothetical protein